MFCNAPVESNRVFTRHFATMVALGLAVIVTGSCAARTTGTGLLPRPDPSAFTPAPSQPERPFSIQADVLSRPIFRTEQAVPFRAEILDLLIPPGRGTNVNHEGLALVETLEGVGIVTRQNQRTPISAGTVFGLSQGETAQIDNSGNEPLTVRVYVITAR